MSEDRLDAGGDIAGEQRDRAGRRDRGQEGVADAVFADPGANIFVQPSDGFASEIGVAIEKRKRPFFDGEVAASCLGAAVFAAPMTITPKAKIIGPSQRSSDTNSAHAVLSKGPAFQLGRAAAGEDEDCVRVTRIVGPDGRVYVTRGLICQE
jgi:hypothetical protein